MGYSAPAHVEAIRCAMAAMHGDKFGNIPYLNLLEVYEVHYRLCFVELLPCYALVRAVCHKNKINHLGCFVASLLMMLSFLLKVSPKNCNELLTGGGVTDVPLHVLAALRVPKSGDAVRDVRHEEEQGPLHHQQDDA